MMKKITKLMIVTAVTLVAFASGGRGKTDGPKLSRVMTDGPKVARLTDGPKSRAVIARMTDGPKSRALTDGPKRGPSPRDIVGSEVTFG